MKQVHYYPESPKTEGESYESFEEYKKARPDEFLDGSGEWRLPQYTVSSDDTFCCGVM